MQQLQEGKRKGTCDLRPPFRASLDKNSKTKKPAAHIGVTTIDSIANGTAKAGSLDRPGRCMPTFGGPKT